MGNNTTSNQFKYNGEKYTFIITLDHTDLKKPITLENQQIIKFSYTNEFNHLYMTAELECTDSYGAIDQLLEKLCVQCCVILNGHKQKTDNSITIEKYDENKMFRHVFIVDNIKITNRKEQVLTYKITMSSINRLKSMSNITYSNYAVKNIKEKGIFNILKNCLLQAGMRVDSDSFDNITTPITLDYITNGNDTPETILKFLLNRLYYHPIKDTSFKALIYNQNYDDYQLFDILRVVNKAGLASIILSMFKSQNESVAAEEPAQLATVTKFPYTEAISNTFTKEFQDYSFNINTITNQTINYESIFQYYNTTAELNGYKQKFKWPLDGTTLNFLARGSYWNNDFNIYENFYKTLTEDNSLVVNCPGNITRCPGLVVNVGIDRDINKMINDSREQLNDMMNRYKGLESLWIIAKVVNIVEPQKQRYRQNLVLFRNYLTKELDKDVKI